MKVRLTTSRAGHGFSQQPGDVIEVSEKEGAVLIERGQAVTVAGSGPKTTKKRRTATQKPPETREGAEHALDPEDATGNAPG